MSSYLVPSIALPPFSPHNGGPVGYTSYQLFNNRQFFTDARTPYARFFIRWDHLQPYQNAASANPATDNTTQIPGYSSGLTPALYMAYMNLMIYQARLDGRKIMLTLYAYPEWVNANRRTGAANPQNREPYLCPPDYVTMGTATAFGSPFDYIVWYLSLYYHPLSPVTPGISMEYFEVLDEPNLQWWPPYSDPMDPMSADTRPQVAAGMMATARNRTRLSTLHLPVIVGPALVDSTRNGDGIHDYRSFISAMLGYFRDLPFQVDQYMAWSFHNYGDIQGALNAPPRNEAYAMLERLKTTKDFNGNVIWKGFPGGDGVSTASFATEGGYRTTKDSPLPDAAYLARQADALQSNWNTMYLTTGVLMVTNYQTWSNPYPYENGLCTDWPEAPNAGGPAAAYERPALHRWANLPTTAPR